MQIQRRLLSEANLKYSKAVESSLLSQWKLPSAMLQNYKASSTQSLIVDKFTESNKTTRAKLAATPYCYPCGGKVMLRLFRSAKNKQLTGNIIIIRP